MNRTTSKILIVDDNTFYLSVLKAILRNIEVEVFMATSGNEALTLINQNDFALAILDIEMPEMDGFELAKHIQDLKNRDVVPIIFLTAYFSDEIQMFKGYDNGAIDYLTKPINKTVFISKVKIFLELDLQKRKMIANKESLQKSKADLELKQKELELQNIQLQKAQSETDESRKKFTKLYDFAPTGYFTICRSGSIHDINLKGARFFGGEPSNLINRNFKEFISSEMLSDLDEFLFQVFETDTQSGIEIRLRQMDEKTTFIYLEGALIDDKQKCLLSMVDITDQKTAQIALKESEDLYHSLLKTSPDGIIIISLDGIIKEASNIAIDLFAKNSDDNIEGNHFSEFIPKASRRSLAKIFKATVHEGMAQNLEIKLSRIDKSEFTGEISSSQIKGNNGELKAFMAVIRDISERKLIEKQLRHSERMSGIGELATGMAHEINQPLNTISLIIDNIVVSLENKTITEIYLKTKINKVFDNISRIKKIIDHVRTFARDQEDFAQTTFEINNSINNCISMISEQMHHQDIFLSFIPDREIPAIKGNPYRFEQVILNLLVNAKDAIDEKKKKVGKKFRQRIDLFTRIIDHAIYIEITDNGIGMKPEDVDKVLLPFYTTKPPGSGTGLGLSISYGIIKELGGDIGIQSKLQSGTTIQIKIPIH